MDPISGWNRRDPAAVLATMASNGTYADPTTGGALSGDAFAGYMKGLFSAFPDVAFEIASVGLAAPDLVAAQWIMRGTNTGSMMGLPPTGKRVEVKGADFIRVTGDKIRSVDGYFDSGETPKQLGLQVIVQPVRRGGSRRNRQPHQAWSVQHHGDHPPRHRRRKSHSRVQSPDRS